MYMIKHSELIDASTPSLGTIVELELITEPGEAVNCFYVDWSINGFSQTIYVPDNITEEDIELNAEDYFSKIVLEKLQVFVELYGDTATIIEACHKKIEREL